VKLRWLGGESAHAHPERRSEMPLEISLVNGGKEWEDGRTHRMLGPQWTLSQHNPEGGGGRDVERGVDGPFFKEMRF
jgi:hypothetical protein